jgi:hypothetical protein
MKHKIIKFSILSIALLVTLDISLSLLADKKIRNESYFVEHRLESATLGSGYGDNYYMSCQLEAVFHVYTFKTCFIRQTQRGVEDWSYLYYYARPFPIVLSFMNDFRFEMIGTGSPKFIIFSDGTTEEVT